MTLTALTLIQMAGEKDIAMRLGVIYDCPDGQ
jgi:hypothetical protein